MAEELQIPPNVLSDSEACELIRAWAAQGGLVCSLNPGAWPQDQAPIAWGILLSDVARHVADALHQTYGLENTAVLPRCAVCLTPNSIARRPRRRGSLSEPKLV